MIWPNLSERLEKRWKLKQLKKGKNDFLSVKDDYNRSKEKKKRSLVKGKACLTFLRKRLRMRKSNVKPSSIIDLAKPQAPGTTGTRLR